MRRHLPDAARVGRARRSRPVDPTGGRGLRARLIGPARLRPASDLRATCTAFPSRLPLVRTVVLGRVTEQGADDAHRPNHDHRRGDRSPDGRGLREQQRVDGDVTGVVGDGGIVGFPGLLSLRIKLVVGSDGYLTGSDVSGIQSNPEGTVVNLDQGLSGSTNGGPTKNVLIRGTIHCG